MKTTIAKKEINGKLYILTEEQPIQLFIVELVVCIIVCILLYNYLSYYLQ